MSDVFTISEPRIGQWTRKERTHCKFGHPYDDTNTGRKLNRKGYLCRECRECGKLRMRRKRENPERKRLDAEKTRRYRERQGDAYLLRIREQRRKKKDWLDAQKVKCARCPETHIACLEFHHRDPRKKEFLLSVAVAKHSLLRIQAEVAKCEVICSNCHRKHHYDERHKGEAS